MQNPNEPRLSPTDKTLEKVIADYNLDPEQLPHIEVDAAKEGTRIPIKKLLDLKDLSGPRVQTVKNGDGTETRFFYSNN